MNDPRELKERMANLTDEELIRMVTEEAADYRSDALDYAKAELRSRNIDYSTPPSDAEEPDESESESVDPLPVRRRDGCPSCNGPLRAGTLMGEKEITIIFSDNKEERFMLVSACGKCGLVSMSVDLETEVSR
jgi:hypothetical protein